MQLYKTKLTPPEPTEEQEKTLKKRAKIRMIIGAVIVVVGFGSHFFVEGMEILSSLLNIIGTALLLYEAIVRFYMGYKKDNTYIGVTEDGQLKMSSLRFGMRRSYHIPIADVSAVVRETGPGKSVAWVFKGSKIKRDIRFNATLFPHKKHKTLLAEITTHGTNIRVLHKNTKPKSVGSTKRPQDDYEFLVGNDS